MLTCVHRPCGKQILGTGFVVNADGDLACSEECKEKYERQRDREMDFIASANDEQFRSWMMGDFEVQG